jgi:hypothetical protein
VADTTNYVESLNSVRRKFADKRLNFSATYKCRANISLLSAFLDNWVELLMKELQIEISEPMLRFLKVSYIFYNFLKAELADSNKQKLRRKTTNYINQRYKQKDTKYFKDDEKNKEFTYKLKEKKEPLAKKEKAQSAVCMSCGKVYINK